ncbi:hypothetical protein SCUCBS95973_003112 [Sporothrix curviconia]|uniref:Uncharacterized protein n=1 Tax=Sporothrix curviconia TaxID=1260050 RepID=A0ABP0BCH0_9PEZI
MAAVALHGGTAPLAALTTVFTPPCPTSWLVTTTKLPSQFPSFPGADPTTACDPPQWGINLSGEGFDFYSPAICPDGFEVGPNCLLTGTPRTTEGFPAVAAGETVAFCVPSGQTCTSDTTDFHGGIWGVLRTATGTGVTVTVGPAMQIRWRDVDLSILATHPLTPGLTLAGATSTTAPPSTTANVITTTPILKLTPDVGVSSSSTSTSTSPTSSPSSSSSSSSSSQTTTSATTATAGFVTIKGKSTQLPTTSLQPITSTMTVVSAGSTFKSTVVTSPTAVAPSPNGSSSSSSNTTSTTSTSTTGSSTSKAFAAAITMACLLSVAAAVIVVFFFFSRRRYQRQQRTQSQKQEQMSGGVLEDGRGDGDGGANANDGSSSIGLSSVGIGAWVQRRKPRWRVAWSRTRTWWSSLRLLPWQRSPRPLTGDNVQSLWRRQQRHRNVASPIPPPPPQKPGDDKRGRARTPLAELPTSERAPAEFVELEGSPVPEILLEGADEDDGDDDGDSDSYMSIQKYKRGIPAKRPGTGRNKNVNRLSWMSRLSRYMRGGRSTPGGGRDSPASVYDDSATGRSVISRASTRSSRWTRTDTASVMTGRGGGLDDDDDPYSAVDDIHNESSWAAFSLSREGLGRLLLVKQNGSGGSSSLPRRGHTRGLSVPNNGGSGSNNIPRLPSPAMTVRSYRTATPGLLSADDHRFSRLSNGTFGRMDSFISRDGSRTGDMPAAGGGGRTSTEAGP